MQFLFLNNRTFDWLEKQPEEFQQNAIDRVRKKIPGMIARYRRRRAVILENTVDNLEKLKMQKEVNQQKALIEKENLSFQFKHHGGIWKTVNEVDEKIRGIKQENEKETAVKIQLSYRKQVLGQKVPRKLLQTGTTVEGMYTKFSLKQLIKNLKEVIIFCDK